MTENSSPINTWYQVGDGGVFISRAYSPGRGHSFRGWRVVGAGFKTDPEAAWYDHGCKVFSRVMHGEPGDRGRGALEAAKAWAGERYGIKNWKRNTMGDYIDADRKYPPLRKRNAREQP